MQYVIPLALIVIGIIAFFAVSSKADTTSEHEQAKIELVDDSKKMGNKVSKKQYSATASYFTPRRDEHKIGVNLSLNGNKITGAKVTYDGGEPSTPSHGAFDGAYKAEVIGKDINEVALSRVGGASLTSNAFNQAVEMIRAQR